MIDPLPRCSNAARVDTRGDEARAATRTGERTNQDALLSTEGVVASSQSTARVGAKEVNDADYLPAPH